YDGSENMGVHLQMSGQGCREYEALNKKKWKELFFDFICYNAKFTRLDVAIDDFQGYFTIGSIERKVKDRLLTSKFKKARTMETILIESGKGEGKTIYFGSSQSSIQVRMYEKNHE
ncbi:replication initiation factor domain-containing protein, partial [Escherichia coli]|nr:replication initiation factor domain-containing protein [Escherichia coli]